MSLFEGLPVKFRGDGTDTDTINIWIKKFKVISELKPWDESTQIKILELWLEGKAAIWFENFTENKKNKNTISLFKGLIKNFDDQNNQEQGDVIVLSGLLKKDHENIKDFNQRFRLYLKTIPKEERPTQLIKKIYLNALHLADREIWWNIVQMDEDLEYNDLIKRTETLASKKEVVEGDQKTTTIKIIEEEIKAANEEKNWDMKMDKLTKDLSSLTLLVKEKFKTDRTDITCHYCGMKGHKTFYCRKKQKDLAENSSSESTESNVKSGMIAMEVNADIDLALTAVNSVKRIRVEDYLNEYNPARPISVPQVNKAPEIAENLKKENNNYEPIKQGINKMGIVEKKRKPLKPKTVSSITNRILDSEAPLTNKELFQIKPQLIPELISGLQYFKRTNVPRKVLVSNEKNKSKALSFVRVVLGDQNVALHVDNGADYSIINSKFIEGMGIELSSMDRPFHIQPLKGVPVTVDKVATILVSFEADIKIPIDFIVMDNIAVQAILGIDALQALRAKIDYANEIILFDYKNKVFEIQLYTRDDILDWEEIFFDDKLEDEAVDSFDMMALYSTARKDIITPVGTTNDLDFNIDPHLDNEKKLVE
ncbi:hypothetical protein BB561_006847 [Smittium simulii]|uniref:Ty3 transposon capsid-like protein domain-containing protein n=1 Tax=Smittium simulii TaxID=133385 RepID=A0A2T9Y126_9FUNG|nr:hypothetical protein BB561_006847 [Smittium simulii]